MFLATLLCLMLSRGRRFARCLDNKLPQTMNAISSKTWKNVYVFGKRSLRSTTTKKMAVTRALNLARPKPFSLPFVLASNDAQSGKLSNDTRTAFDNLWALQQTAGANKGAWLWQLFDLNPWEGNISPYYGATLAAIAVGTVPENYRSAPEIQNNLKMLRDYLDREYSSQPLINRITLLWASSRLPGLLTPERQKSITEEVLSKQQQDGGWSLFPLARTWRDWGLSSLLGKWKRDDGTLQETSSDGYATGLTIFVLQQTGVSREKCSARARQGMARNEPKQNGRLLACLFS